MKQQYRMRVVTEEQLQDDISNTISTIDDLSAAALSLTSGGQQAYTQFISIRDGFRDKAIKLKNDYQNLYL